MTNGICEIGAYVPEQFADAIEAGAKLGVDPSFITDKLGTRWLPRLDDALGTADMAVAAARDALARWGGDAGRIRVLVVCTQSPEGEGLPHTSAVVHRLLGLGNEVAAFDVSLGCSGYVYGLSVVDALLGRIGGDGVGLLITADPYSRMLNNEDRDTALLFGDAATATIIGPAGELKLGRVLMATDGAGGDALVRRGGHFVMAGRRVFNFAATRVPEQIRQLLQLEGLDSGDIDAFILHQGSRYIVETIAGRLGIDQAKAPILMSETGNTVSSSVPLVLRHVIRDAAHRRVVVSGFGVGLSWASMLLSRGAPATAP